MVTNPLINQSPALAGKLKRLSLNEPEMKMLLNSYEISVAYGANEEIGFTRVSGASYNPRAARICLILLTLGEVCDPRILSAALLTSSQKNLKDSAINNPELTTLLQVTRDIKKGNYKSATRETTSVVLSVQLDLFRHLHLTTHPSSFFESELTIELYQKALEFGVATTFCATFKKAFMRYII